MESAFIPLSLAAGSLLAVQAGANTQLSKALGSPFAATTVQLAVGALLVFLFSGLTGSLHALSALPSVTWWHAMGGTASAFYVVSTIALFMRLGAVVTVGLSIAGQILASLALDASGALGVPWAAIQASTVIGTTLVLAGATAIVLGQSTGQAAAPLVSRLPWIALGLAAGAVLPIQGAINGLLRVELQAPLAVATTSFVVATLAMAAVLPLAAVLGKASRPSLSHLRTLGGAGSAASRASSTSPPCSWRCRSSALQRSWASPWQVSRSRPCWSIGTASSACLSARSRACAWQVSQR